MNTWLRDDEEIPILFRMSGAGHCPRRQGYRSLGYEESNPPERYNRNIMALGDAAENILIDNMIEDGWDVRHTRAVPGGEQLSIGNTYPPMTGHPDGICRHAEHTAGQWMTLECKSMGPDKLEDVGTNGLAAIYPEYVAQAAFYARILFNHEMVAEPRAAIFAVMDRMGKNPAPEWVEWTPRYESLLRAKVTETWETVVAGELPERPYEPDHEKCGYCPFFTLCHGLERKPPWSRNEIEFEDAEILDAAEAWLEADAQRRKARERLMAALPYEHGGPTGVAGNAKMSWFIPNDPDQFDMDELRRMLTEDQIREVRRPAKVQPAFWIRPIRRD